MTLKESFEPIVMFFKLTNFPAMFQTMINEVLWNLINIGKVRSFIDNIIMKTEEEKEYNEVVKEVVKRLAENDLYIKPEKCKWKIKKVGFLGTVIGLKEIKIEEEKIKRVLNWPTQKEVKDV